MARPLRTANQYGPSGLRAGSAHHPFILERRGGPRRVRLLRVPRGRPGGGATFLEVARGAFVPVEAIPDGSPDPVRSNLAAIVMEWRRLRRRGEVSRGASLETLRRFYGALNAIPVPERNRGGAA